MSKSKRRNTTVDAASQEFVAATVHPSLFKAIENICRDALHFSQGHKIVRERVTELLMVMEKDGGRQFGHRTIDALMIRQLLQRSQGVDGAARPSEPDEDEVERLFRRQELSSEAVEAATHIRDTWRAFGRFLVLTGKSYDKPMSSRVNKALDPIQVMGAPTLNFYRDVYVPWHNGAKTRLHPSTRFGQINAARIVLDILVWDTKPRLLDKIYGFDRGTAKKVLQLELESLISESSHTTTAKGDSDE